MIKELEMTKKLAVLGWLLRQELITENEYDKIKRNVLKEYNLVSVS